VSEADAALATSLFNQAGVRASVIGRSTPDRRCEVRVGGKPAVAGGTAALRDVWEETSFALERLQVGGVFAGGFEVWAGWVGLGGDRLRPREAVGGGGWLGLEG
jgi:hypothetical protein